MPLQKLERFTKKVQDLSNIPLLNPEDLKAQFDASSDEVRTYLNKLIDSLQSIVDGDSGADNIKATVIENLNGDTVQALLESLKEYIDNTTLGKIPDGTLTDTKLSNNASEIKQRVAKHHVEKVTDIAGAHGLTIESGTFTPTITQSNTYTIQRGSYYKVGKNVHCDIILVLNGKQVNTGNVLIYGLPFVLSSAKNTSAHASIGLITQSVLDTGYTQFTGYMHPGYSYVALYEIGNLKAASNLTSDKISNNTEIRLSVEYETN